MDPHDGARPTLPQRIAAAVALLALAGGLGYLTIMLGRRWDVLLLALTTLAVTVVALWFAVSRRGPARVVSAVVAVAALVGLVVVVVTTVDPRAVLVPVVLIVVSAAAARRALHAPTVRAPATEPPRHPVLFMNPRSGGGKVESYDLPARCRDLGIEAVILEPGDDLQRLAQEAVAGGADVLGMAGGDGSQAVVAGVARQHHVPFVVVPAGTRNHFALDLGLERTDPAAALDAFLDGVDRTVDLAEVNGRTFVNNASMGAYARVVQSDEYRDAKIRTALSVLPDVLGSDAAPMDLRYQRPDGEPATTAHLLLVSNNPYRLSPLLGAGTRDRLDSGVLGVLSLLIGGQQDSEQLARMRRQGRTGPLPGLQEWTAPELIVSSSAPVEVGVDGEALVLDPPLRFVILPGALVVRLPRSALERSDHLYRTSGVTALWRIATGAATEGTTSP